MTVPGAAPAARNDRGALTHDDRLDAVAGAVAHFQRAMMMDVNQAAKAMRDEEALAEIEDFLRGLQPADLPRHADQRPAGRYLVIPAWMVRGQQARGRVAGGPEILGRLNAVLGHLTDPEAANFLAV